MTEKDNMGLDDTKDSPGAGKPEKGVAGKASSPSGEGKLPPGVTEAQIAAALAAAMKQGQQGSREVQEPGTGGKTKDAGGGKPGEGAEGDEGEESPGEAAGDRERVEKLAKLDAEEEDIKKMQELHENLKDKDNESEFAGMLNESGIPKGAVRNALKQAGHDDKWIDGYMDRHGGELTGPELTEDDIANAPEPDVAERIAEEMKEDSDFMRAKAKMERGEQADDDDVAVIENAKVRTGLNRRLFNEETGLLRSQDWKNRLLAKPLGVGVLATLIAYLLLLNSMTKWATKK